MPRRYAHVAASNKKKLRPLADLLDDVDDFRRGGGRGDWWAALDLAAAAPDDDNNSESGDDHALVSRSPSGAGPGREPEISYPCVHGILSTRRRRDPVSPRNIRVGSRGGVSAGGIPKTLRGVFLSILSKHLANFRGSDRLMTQART